jgi:hypothetical protein
MKTEGSTVPPCAGLIFDGREKVVAKNGPFSLTFCQIVPLMLPQRRRVSGFFVGSHLVSSFV